MALASYVLAAVGCQDVTPPQPRTDAVVPSPPIGSVDAKPASPEASALVGSTYELPPADVVEIIDAKPSPDVLPSPSGKHLLVAQRDALPSIEILARPFERLAGIRIDPARNAARRTRFFSRLDVIDVQAGGSRMIELPPDSELGTPQWSPDGRTFAVARSTERGLELWIGDIEGNVRRLLDAHLNDTIGPGFVWMPGSRELLVWLVRSDAPPPPPPPRVPSGPIVEDTAGKRATNRTYQDLLRNPHDEALFEHFATAQMAIVSIEDGQLEALGDPATIGQAAPSPDGRYVLRHRIRRPYSYAVPHSRFARVIEVLDREARVVRVVADQDVAEEIPIGGVRTGARDVQWHAQAPATLVWVEALDEGDPKRKVPHRDRVMMHAAPFADVPTERARVKHRLTSLVFTEQPGQALLTEYDRDLRWTTTWLHDLEGKGAEPRKLVDRSVHDAYGDPGRPVTRVREDGTEVVVVSEGSLYLSGNGASPRGDRPFLARMSLSDGKIERLWESEEGTHTRFVSFVDPGDHQTFLVCGETPESPPNYFVVSPSGQRKLTDFPHPHPRIPSLEKRLLEYKRRDGVPLSAELYLPVGYQEGQRVPLLVWAYPVEYTDGDTAGQVRAAPYRFARLEGTSPLMFVTQGYAVMDAAMPIVGDPETMNDTFVRQIVWAAEAAIDAAAAEGVADRDRVAVGGHSYGAFMAANLLAHSDLFRAGIARSGAYNRTLTPFGFQNERRTLWEAPEVYVAVSPLFAADRIRAPLLLVHGEVDDNSGTFPVQSQRLFAAIQGNGGIARLVLLPHEAHGYQARESVLHVVAESFEWLHRWVDQPHEVAEG